jgi:hypothetical protein
MFTAGRARYSMRARIDARALPPLRDAFALDAPELARASEPGTRAVLDALAYVVARRVGVERLAGLCREARLLGHARIPARWIWSAAQLDPDETIALRRAARDLLGDAEIRALLLREDLDLAAPAEPGPDP